MKCVMPLSRFIAVNDNLLESSFRIAVNLIFAIFIFNQITRFSIK